MPVAVAPSTEACLALVDQINAGTAYALDCLATYARLEITPLAELNGLRVEVVSVDEVQLNRTFAIEDSTSHTIAIWIRDRLPSLEPEEIDARCLLVRQIWQRVNNFDSADRRVSVWETGEDTRLTPDKSLLRQSKLFVASIVLRVEVEASP